MWLYWVAEMGLAVPAACAAECNPREDAGAQLLKIIVTYRCGGGKAGLRYTHETGTYWKLDYCAKRSWSGSGAARIIHMSMKPMTWGIVVHATDLSG